MSLYYICLHLCSMDVFCTFYSMSYGPHTVTAMYPNIHEYSSSAYIPLKYKKVLLYKTPSIPILNIPSRYRAYSKSMVQSGVF